MSLGEAAHATSSCVAFVDTCKDVVVASFSRPPSSWSLSSVERKALFLMADHPALLREEEPSQASYIGTRLASLSPSRRAFRRGRPGMYSTVEDHSLNFRGRKLPRVVCPRRPHMLHLGRLWPPRSQAVEVQTSTRDFRTTSSYDATPVASTTTSSRRRPSKQTYIRDFDYNVV